MIKLTHEAIEFILKHKKFPRNVYTLREDKGVALVDCGGFDNNTYGKVEWIEPGDITREWLSIAEAFAKMVNGITNMENPIKIDAGDKTTLCNSEKIYALGRQFMLLLE